MAGVKDQLNIRFSDEGKQKLVALQERYGLSQSGVVEMLVRDRVIELSAKEGFDWKKRKLGGR